MPTIAQIKQANAKSLDFTKPAKGAKQEPKESTPLHVHAAVVLGATVPFAVFKAKRLANGTKTFAQNVAESYKFYDRELNS